MPRGFDPFEARKAFATNNNSAGGDYIGDTVIVTEYDGWAEIRITREEKRNAMNRASRRALMAAFDALRGKANAVDVSGNAKSFCAGIDLKEADQDVAQLGPDAVNVNGDEWTTWQSGVPRFPGRTRMSKSP